MTYEESVPIARELAERALKKGFDADAFLILTALRGEDTVPESSVDEGFREIAVKFSLFWYEPSNESLAKLLKHMEAVLTELYEAMQNEEQQLKFKEFLNTVQNIIK